MSIYTQITSLFSHYLNKKPSCFSPILDARQSLRVLNAFFSKQNIPSYAICGTLLGCIRNNALFSYDNDIDLAIHETDLIRFSQCIPALLDQGFVMVELGWSVIKFRSIPSDCHIDIWVIEPLLQV
tara:strand:- start:27 stop:404 length:378 start_codon:yes stop_codon:yes gene_type:complete